MFKWSSIFEPKMDWIWECLHCGHRWASTNPLKIRATAISKTSVKNSGWTPLNSLMLIAYVTNIIYFVIKCTKFWTYPQSQLLIYLIWSYQLLMQCLIAVFVFCNQVEDLSDCLLRGGFLTGSVLLPHQYKVKVFQSLINLLDRKDTRLLLKISRFPIKKQIMLLIASLITVYPNLLIWSW